MAMQFWILQEPIKTTILNSRAKYLKKKEKKLMKNTNFIVLQILTNMKSGLLKLIEKN